jgi:hypothetical protein
VSRPPTGRPAPRRGTSLLLVSLLGVLTAVLLIVFVLRLARSPRTKVQLGANTFDAGKAAQDLAPHIAQGGPVLFQGLRGPGLDLYVQHLGTDPLHGWLAFSADAPGGCVLLPRLAQHTLACQGMTFPDDGRGLDHYAVTVDSKGKVIVNLQLSTGTTPRPT